MRIAQSIVVVMISMLTSPVWSAELILPTVFSDHMVLQREQDIPVWGTAAPDADVTVDFAGKSQTTTADAAGKWRVTLSPLAASAESRELTVTANSEQVKLTDVLVGEVWLCSGQSNMQWSMKQTDGKGDIETANHPLIRLYDTPRVPAFEPVQRIKSKWQVCTPETVSNFSGVAYYFGRFLQQELDVPVGLLLSTWGGTRIEPWTPPCGFEGIPALAELNENVKKQLKKNDKSGKPDRQAPTHLYNGMLHAHIPFAIRGAIWYQGESNHTEGMLYRDKTEALVRGWREVWGYEFPYYFIQIAPFQYGKENPAVLAKFWEAQAKVVTTVPNTAMAVISDHTTLNNIHPPNKKVPGTRLALLALSNTYGKNVVSSGPVFKSLEAKGNHLDVAFESADGLKTRDGKTPDWFEITGADGVFKPASAEINGSVVRLSSPEVTQPVAMRFAWHKLATPNLVNGAGLPPTAFRAGDAPNPDAPNLILKNEEEEEEEVVEKESASE